MKYNWVREEYIGFANYKEASGLYALREIQKRLFMHRMKIKNKKIFHLHPYVFDMVITEGRERFDESELH